MRLIAIFLLLAVFPLRLAWAETVEGHARVIDGDTIEIDDERIRLWGIDAPEISQRCAEDGHQYPCGLDAGQALRRQIGLKPVICTRRDTDRYGRMVALCTVEGADISQWMVRQGQAIAFHKYSLDYVADEDLARATKIGIWAGEFQDPSDFRHGARHNPVPEHAVRRVCGCPDDTDRAGRRCGRRSSFMRLGGKTSKCTASR